MSLIQKVKKLIRPNLIELSPKKPFAFTQSTNF